MLLFKNYVGHVQYDDESEIFHGEIVNIRDVVTFQGTSVDELKQAFIDSIEDYLEFCATNGEEPDKPFSGKFNLRIDPTLHREIVVASKRSGESLNAWIVHAIKNSLPSTCGRSISE